jgi:transcription antitermination factor NusG
MDGNKKWYAVYTRARWEKKVADILSRRKIENYCPINKVTRQWSDRKKIIDEPLFTSYVFVHAPESELTLLRKIDGIINLVYWLGKPALIRDSEIETIKRFLNEHRNIKLEKAKVNLNDTVRIVAGPLMEHEGQVISIKNRTVKVLLPSLGYLMVAETETSNVEVIVRTLTPQEGMSYTKYAIK